MRRSSLGLLVAPVALGTCLFLVATPSKAAITFGSNLNAPATDVSSVGSTAATESNIALPASSTALGGLTSPIDGVVVRWRMKVGSGVFGQATPRLIQPGNSATATGAGIGAAAVTPQPNSINVFPTRMPVKAGEGIAYDLQNSGFESDNRTPGGTIALWLPALLDGAAPRAGITFANDEHLINADVELDCDKDGFGDETQDPEVSPCSPAPAPGPGPSLGAAAPTCSGKQATMIGTEGADQITGTPVADVIVGLGGNDVIKGGDQADVVCGNGGDDVINGKSGEDLLLGDEGNDRLNGAGKNDHLFGGPGKDRLGGGFGRDRLFGGPGVDQLFGGFGTDTLRGGPGKDKQVQ